MIDDHQKLSRTRQVNIVRQTRVNRSVSPQFLLCAVRFLFVLFRGQSVYAVRTVVCALSRLFRSSCLCLRLGM